MYGSSSSSLPSESPEEWADTFEQEWDLVLQLKDKLDSLDDDQALPAPHTEVLGFAPRYVSYIRELCGGDGHTLSSEAKASTVDGIRAKPFTRMTKQFRKLVIRAKAKELRYSQVEPFDDAAQSAFLAAIGVTGIATRAPNVRNPFASIIVFVVPPAILSGASWLYSKITRRRTLGSETLLLLVSMTKLLNEMADAGEQIEELLLGLNHSLLGPTQLTLNPTPTDPHIHDRGRHFEFTMYGVTYRPDLSEIRKVPLKDVNNGSSKTLRATDAAAATLPHIGFRENPLSGVLDVLRNTMSTDEQVALMRSRDPGYPNEFRFSQKTLSALSTLQLDKLTRSRLAFVEEPRRTRGDGQNPPKDVSEKLQEPPRLDPKAILEEADHLERLLTRPSSYLLITLYDDPNPGRDSLDDVPRLEPLTKISSDTYLCKTLVDPAETLAAVKQLDCVGWAGYYMKGFILGGLYRAEPELRWWGLPREQDPLDASNPIKPDRRYPLDEASASRKILVELVPHRNIKMSDFILAVGRILPPEDHPGLSPARGSTTLRIQATLEQLIELTASTSCLECTRSG